MSANNMHSSFAANSSAKGVLYAFIYITVTNETNYTKSCFRPVTKENAINGTPIDALPQGRYTLASFDIESDGMVQQGAPAFNQTLQQEDSEHNCMYIVFWIMIIKNRTSLKLFSLL